MIDKIKVNLANYVYNILLEDMIRFEAYRSNGDVNRNNFLNCVIYNFYFDKMQKREQLKDLLLQDAILEDITEKNKEKIINSAIKIMDDYYGEDVEYKYHGQYFMIYPTKQTLTFFNDIYENEIKNSVSLSSFTRRLLNEYSYLPQYVREAIVKRTECTKLYEASETGNIVIFTVSKKECRIAPFCICTNIEETHNYLLGLDLASKEPKPISIKLCKIHNIIVLKDVYKFTKEQNIALNKIMDNGVEYASGEILSVQIKASSAAQRMFTFKIHNRPNIKHIKEDIFEVSCSFSNFVNYFIQYGKEITILNNQELKEHMFKFYKSAMEKFQ